MASLRSLPVPDDEWITSTSSPAMSDTRSGRMSSRTSASSSTFKSGTRQFEYDLFFGQSRKHPAQYSQNQPSRPRQHQYSSQQQQQQHQRRGQRLQRLGPPPAQDRLNSIMGMYTTEDWKNWREANLIDAKPKQILAPPPPLTLSRTSPSLPMRTQEFDSGPSQTRIQPTPTQQQSQDRARVSLEQPLPKNPTSTLPSLLILSTPSLNARETQVIVRPTSAFDDLLGIDFTAAAKMDFCSTKSSPTVKAQDLLSNDVVVFEGNVVQEDALRTEQLLIDFSGMECGSRDLSYASDFSFKNGGNIVDVVKETKKKEIEEERRRGNEEEEEDTGNNLWSQCQDLDSDSDSDSDCSDSTTSDSFTIDLATLEDLKSALDGDPEMKALACARLKC